jgi:hypothetical protein
MLIKGKIMEVERTGNFHQKPARKRDGSIGVHKKMWIIKRVPALNFGPLASRNCAGWGNPSRHRKAPDQPIVDRASAQRYGYPCSVCSTSFTSDVLKHHRQTNNRGRAQVGQWRIGLLRTGKP